MNIPVYIVNFHDEHRKSKMTARFESVGVTPHFTPPVYTNDTRLSGHSCELRTCAIMLQHLDGLRHFVDHTDADHAIVCEDDIYVSKTFSSDLPKIVADFDAANLDVLLLGYLWPYQVDSTNPYFAPIGTRPFYSYPDDLWGSQMYLVSRRHANTLLEKYTMDFVRQFPDKPFSPDWTLTKDGKRALLVPMLAVEEGTTKTDHQGQNDFHQRCFEAHYDADKYY